MKAIERIYQYIDFKGIKAVPFEKEIGLSNGYLGKQLKRNADLGEGVMLKIIENCPDLEPEWLLTGNGVMLKTKSKENVPLNLGDNLGDKNWDKPKVKKRLPMDLQIVAEPNSEYQAVIRKIKFAEGVNIAEEGAPFYPLPVSAGTVAELIREEEKPTGYISIPGVSCKAYFPVIGFSFGDIIPAGSIIGVDFINNWETLDPDCVYFIVTHDQRMAKRLVADPEDQNGLICLSPNFHQFKISKDDIKVIHKVVFVGKPI